MKHLYSLTSLKVLLIVVVMTCSSFARGQSFDYNPYDTVKAKTIHHEFGMSLYSQPNFESLSTFVNLPQNRSIEFVFLLFWYYYDTVASNPDYKFTNSFNFFYKLHWKDYAFRLGYTSNRLTYRNVVDSTYWNANTLGWFKMYSGTYQMQRLSLGCEKNYSLKRFDFYYALDVAYYWGFIFYFEQAKQDSAEFRVQEQSWGYAWKYTQNKSRCLHYSDELWKLQR